MAQLPLRQVLEQAMQHQRAGKFAEAANIYRLILNQKPDEPNALHLLGLIEYQAGRREQAMQMIRKAVSTEPKSSVFRGNLAQVLTGLGHHNEAIAEFRQSLALRPNVPEVLCNFGTLLHTLGQFDEAIPMLQRAASLSPDNTAILNNLGNALRDQGDYQQALEPLRRAVTLKPHGAEIHNNLGNALQDAGLIDEAIGEFRQALALHPNFPEAHNNLGSALRLKGQFEQALIQYRRAAELAPDYAMPHFNVGLVSLLLGRFEEGWRGAEWRWLAREHRLNDNTTGPKWAGEDISGKRILLYAEQGFGDAIQFVRYAPMVTARGARVIVRCHPEQHRLFQQLEGVEQVISTSDPLPEYDVRCPLMTLPMVFKTDLSNIPANIPYLSADPDIASRWRKRVDEFDGKIKVGLAWSGRPTHRFDRQRSIEPAILSPLLQNPRAAFFSLQKAGKPLPITDWTSELNDFLDTAGLIASLDLIITVDTAVAHLAGAMGKPVWVLLPFVPDWRWLLERTDSPWYPTMRLFRQLVDGDWNTPIHRVVEALGTFQS